MKSFQERIEDNIRFIESVLQNYPLEEFQHCKLPAPETHRFKPIEKKDVQVEWDGKHKTYHFDSQTNHMAAPKIHLIRESRLKYQKLLQKFQSDVRNATVIETVDSDEYQDENKKNEIKSRLLMTPKEIEEQQRQQMFARGAKQYRNLKVKRNRLLREILEQQRKLDEFQVS
jgi:hypothetical protein